jgi:hypothetical protein
MIDRSVVAIDESGIDCGGSTCDILCGLGEGCNTVDDCAEGYDLCYGTCQVIPSTYGNGLKDGYETGIDCGGPYKACALNTPCVYNAGTVTCHGCIHCHYLSILIVSYPLICLLCQTA